MRKPPWLSNSSYFVQDSDCLNNLIDNPEYAEMKKELSAKLDAWMESQGDKGAETEEIAHTRKAGYQKRAGGQKGDSDKQPKKKGKKNKKAENQ